MFHNLSKTRKSSPVTFPTPDASAIIATRYLRGAKMSLAIFDLDNTLLGDDSDYLWGKFLVEQQLVDREFYERENQRFYEEYKQGSLDILEFLAFSLKPLTRIELSRLQELHEQFMEEKIKPVILPRAEALLEKHRGLGDTLLIITATNRFITEPIARELGVENLIATDPEIVDGNYTGKVSGTPCFREGKVSRLEQWLADNQ
ncbi:HAD family hydrolase, partial [Kaarinaea lacus]